MPERHSRGGRPAVGEPLLDRAFRILGAFDEHDPVLTLTELSTRAAIPLSTTLRLAQSLARQGALERREDGTFALGVRLLELAALAPRGHGLRAIALPYMSDLHAATHQHVQLAIRDGNEAVILERLSAPRAGRVLFHVGSRIPLHGTGLGMVLLAHARAEFQAAYLTRELVMEPEHTPIDAAELRRRLDDVRTTGVCRFSRLLPEPTDSVAAPVFGRGGACIAALSVLGVSGSLASQMVQPAVVAISRAISRDLRATDASDH